MQGPAMQIRRRGNNRGAGTPAPLGSNSAVERDALAHAFRTGRRYLLAWPAERRERSSRALERVLTVHRKRRGCV